LAVNEHAISPDMGCKTKKTKQNVKQYNELKNACFYFNLLLIKKREKRNRIFLNVDFLY